MQALTAPAVPATDGFFDECITDEAEFSLGFLKPNSGFPFGSASSFGHPGAGGSLGFADPGVQTGYAYVPNRKGVTLCGDPRDVALRRALQDCMIYQDYHDEGLDTQKAGERGRAAA